VWAETSNGEDVLLGLRSKTQRCVVREGESFSKIIRRSACQFSRGVGKGRVKEGGNKNDLKFVRRPKDKQDGNLSTEFQMIDWTSLYRYQAEERNQRLKQNCLGGKLAVIRKSGRESRQEEGGLKNQKKSINQRGQSVTL